MHMHRTKMIFTLGPATDAPGVLPALLRAGMDGARFNFSHGRHGEHARRFRTLRAAARRARRPIAAIMDLCGPKLRVGDLAEPLRLRAGAKVRLRAGRARGGEGIPVAHPTLAEDTPPGSRVLLDDGQIELRVLRREGADVLCRVVVGGLLHGRKGINLPDAEVSLPALTSKDKRDLAFGLGLGMDYVALSFVRRPEEVKTLKQRIRRAGSTAGVIAKIEKPQAVDRLEEIILAADGVMVARGDLGVEMRSEQVPALQKRIIALARRYDRLVISATQMLQSMMVSPTPTRAETSDVANAIFDQSDGVMLSGETAAGRYPREAAVMMGRILTEAEGAPQLNHPAPDLPLLGTGDALLRAAVDFAERINVRVLVAFTHSGATARLVSRLRPRTPVVVFAHDDVVRRRLSLLWGVETLLIRKALDTEALLRAVEKGLLEHGLARRGERVVVVASSPVRRRAHANFMKIHVLGQS